MALTAYADLAFDDSPDVALARVKGATDRMVGPLIWTTTAQSVHSLLRQEDPDSICGVVTESGKMLPKKSVVILEDLSGDRGIVIRCRVIDLKLPSAWFGTKRGKARDAIAAASGGTILASGDE